MKDQFQIAFFAHIFAKNFCLSWTILPAYIALQSDQGYKYSAQKNRQQDCFNLIVWARANWYNIAVSLVL